VNYFKQKFNDANNGFDVSNCCGLSLAPNFSANGVTAPANDYWTTERWRL